MAVSTLMPDQTHAAGGAYYVDIAEAASTGSCKVESWASFAGNKDFFAAAVPTCGINAAPPVEMSAQISRDRTSDEWSTAVTPRLKTNLIPTAIGAWGLGLSAAAAYDNVRRDNTALMVAAPVTLRLSNVMRINVNNGWMWDRITGRHYLTYGAGLDWRTPENNFIFTAEIFGLAGSADVKTVTQPGFQAGIRFRPVDQYSFDIIYGRNIAGENANWITLVSTVRFNVLDK